MTRFRDNDPRGLVSPGSRRERDDSTTDTDERPWHERTGLLAGASVAALVVIALLYFLISTIAREFSEPPAVPQYYMEPTGGSSTPYRPGATSTTTPQTITSTSPPVTTDINPGDPTASSSTTDTSTRLPSTRRTQDDDDDPTSTRSRPRLNETRTLYPRP